MRRRTPDNISQAVNLESFVLGLECYGIIKRFGPHIRDQI